jgi:hypothetical protein
MTQDDSGQETVFADLKIGERFSIGTGITFRKNGERTASVADEGEAPREFTFGLTKPVTRV